MALPKELTNIPVDNDYSMDEAAIIENLISSGRLSVQQVSDYFGLPAAAINNVLQQDFGYTPEQVAQVATPSPVAQALSAVPADGNYSMEDAKAVENAIRSGQVTTQQVSDYYNVPIEDVNRVLTTDLGYTPAQTQLATVARDNDYSMEDARIVENAIKSGQVTIQDVSDYFNVPVADVNRVLTTDFGYTPDQIAAAGGTATSQETATTTTTDTAANRATTGATTGDTTGTVTGGLTGRTVPATDSQNVFAQQGVGQDISGIMGGQQGYTGGTLQNGNIRYNDPNVIGGQVNMPQVGVIGAEAALQGGLAGGLAGLQEGLATGATGLTGAVSSGLQELRRALGQGRQDITAGYGRAEQGFQPYMAGGAAAQSQLEALSGARGQEAFQQAYQESPYIQFLREQGMRANLAGAAATGGLGGGNVQKELARFGQGLASQGLQQQIQNLQQLSGQGLQATQGAGQYAAGGAGQLAGLEQAQGTQALGAMQNVGQQLANLGLAGGQTAAQMGYGTGQKLADIRTRAGELLAGEISNVGRDVSGLASALGGDISGVYGAQSKNLADLLVQSGMAQADATRISAQLLSNIATGASGQVAGLGTSVGQPTQTQGILGQVGQLASGIGTGFGGYAAFKDLS